MDYIVTAIHYAKERHGVDTVKERIFDMQRQKARGGIKFPIIDKTDGAPAIARIESGQWIADCECGGAEFVDKDEPIFFCFSCANWGNENRLRPVKFPKKIDQIESILLERPIDDKKGLDDLQRAEASRSMIFVEGQGYLSRSWTPGETLEDLKEQQDEPIKKWKKKGDK